MQVKVGRQGMGNDLIIRKAQTSDAQQITAHRQEIAREPGAVLRDSDGIPSWTPEQTRLMEEDERERIASCAASEGAIMLVAEISGRIVGVMDLQLIEAKGNVDSAAVGLTVELGFRNQGVASALLSRAVEWAAAGDAMRRIVLNVMTTNAPAIHLYEKFGFRIEGDPFRPRGFGVGAPKLVKMTLNL